MTPQLCGLLGARAGAPTPSSRTSTYSTGLGGPSVKDAFDASLECGNLAYGFLRLHCGDCDHDKLVAFSCKRRGFCPSCGARHMAHRTAQAGDAGSAGGATA